MKKKRVELQDKDNEKLVRAFQADHRKRWKWYRTTGSMAAVVVLITVYLLILPAITMERQTVCGMEEHVHDESCYAEESTEDLFSDGTEETVSFSSGENFISSPEEDKGVLICGKEEHIHTESCYPQEESVDEVEEIQESQLDTEDIMEDENISEDYDVTWDDLTIDDNSTEEDDLTESGASDEERKLAGTADKFILTEDEVTKTTISYKCPDADPEMTEWQEVTDTVILHGDDSLKLLLEYANVPVSDVKEADYKIYYALPQWLQEADGSQTSTLTDPQYKAIGTITAENGYLIAAYDPSWLDAQTGNTLQGSLSMEVHFATDQVRDSTLTIGDFTIHVDYNQGDWEASFGTVNLEKSEAKYIEQPDGYDLLEYTLTVTTGDTTMADIQVKDSFTDINEADYIQEISGVTEEETMISDTMDGLTETSNKESFVHGTICRVDGEMIWNIGNMQANETRTLTYQVKLKRECTGRSHTSALVFHNVATLYASGIERGTADSQFNAIGKTTMEKKMISYEPDDDGIGGTITYCIMVQALAENTYTMDNLKIFDFSGGYQGYTNPAPEVEIITDSFHLYEGDARNNKGSGLEEIPLDADTDMMFTEENGNFKNFTCYIGDFEPGQTKTLIYQMRVKDAMYLDNNGSFTLNNRATVYEDDTKNTVVPSPNSGQIQAYLATNTISYGKWERKYTGVRQEAEQTITMDENVYETTDSSVTSVDTPADFIVPEGSYLYHVIVNEAGVLDVNSVTMVDLLGTKMQYTGYVRVDAYDSLEQQNLDGSTLGELSGTIIRTAWLKIDSSSSFSFTPAQLGFSGTNAYSLTYYTKLVDVTENTYVDVSNSFTMSGTVFGDESYSLINGGIRVSVSTHAMASSGFQAEKSAWYYERPLADAESQWSKGTLYWYIRATGTDIPAGIVMKDQIEGSGHQMIASESLAGIYLGSETIPSSLEELTGNEISSDLYEVGWESSAVTIKFLQSVAIPENQAVYIVIKTAITNQPGQNQTKSYKNSFWQKNGDSDFSSVNTASQTVVGGNTCAKTLQGAFIYDGSTYWNAGNTGTQYSRGQGGHLKTTDKSAERLEPGTYIEYLIDVSKRGTLTGDVTISDILPEGLEVAFLRNAWFNNCTADNVEIEGLDETQWQEYTETDKPGANVKTDCIYYYNSETRELRWKVSNIAVTNANASADQKFIRFQLVCKVVDPDVLLGVESKSFTNSMTVIQDNQIIEKDTADTVTLSRSMISKAIDGNQSGNVIPFKIVVNELGEDMIGSSNKIVLVDELSSDLTLDFSSIQVTDNTGQVLTDIQIAVENSKEKTCLKLTIPDDRELTITYEAMVNALPDKKVSISNIAHWEGYDAAPGSSVVNNSFSYSVDGVAEVTGQASLKLIKRDAQNIQKKLQGATFTMQEAILQEDGSRELSGEVHTATTDENGEIIFSTEQDGWWMKYDTLYCLTEIEAPEGYACDSTPKYIVLATKNNREEYPEDVLVRRNLTQFIYEATNNEDRPAYVLPETGGSGTVPYRMIGLIFIIVTAGCVTLRKHMQRNSSIRHRRGGQ